MHLITLRDTEASPEGAIAFVEEYLKAPSSIWKKTDLSTQQKLQLFQFPLGVTFDGKKFETSQIVSLFKAKDAFGAPLSASVVILARY